MNETVKTAWLAVLSPIFHDNSAAFHQVLAIQSFFVLCSLYYLPGPMRDLNLHP